MYSTLKWFLVFLFITSPLLAEDWPQWRGPRRDGTWQAANIVEKFDAKEAKRVWSVPVGSGYSGPSVADGRVFITDRVLEPEEIERIHCFDFKTGNKIWSKEYTAPYGAVGYKAGPRASVAIEGRDRANALFERGRWRDDLGAGSRQGIRHHAKG